MICSRLFLGVLTTCCFLFAQTPDTATLSGQVLDESLAPIHQADVTVLNELSGFKRSIQTNTAGEFSFTGLGVNGNYSVLASKKDFASAKQSAITLRAGTEAALTIRLSVAPSHTQISVTGTSGEIRTDQPQLGVQLSSGGLLDVPLLNRRLTNLPLLNSANRPAINQGDVFMNQTLFTTNGAGRRQTTFIVDGSTANDSWGRQTIFTNVPLASVHEVDVLTNAFSAEYGGSTGSVVNIVTKSGGQDLHGEFLALGRPDQIGAALSGFSTSNAANGNDITSDRLLQSALTLSGPIGSGSHTQFLVSGEASFQDRASPITSPLAPGSYVGRYRGWLGGLRVDHQINDRQSLFFRSAFDGFYDTNPNGTVGGNTLPTVARIFRRRTYSEALGETAVLSPRVVNNFRLQFQLASPITQFQPVVNGTQYVIPISTGGTFTSGTSQSALLLNRQYQIGDTLALTTGRHQIKFGLDALFARNGGNSKEFGGPIYLGQFTYNTCTQSLAVCESPDFLNNIQNVRTYTQSYGNANYTINDALVAGFVQDDYRVRQDLTVNLGLRYERQTFTDSQKNFSPRVGFSYDWKGEGKTVIRSGFGIYYSQIVDNAQANYALSGPTGVFNYTASPGQIGFPASVTSAPLAAFPAGAVTPVRSIYVRPGEAAYLSQFFPTSALTNYPNLLLSPYSEQWTFSVEQRIHKSWILGIDYVGSHTIRINRPLDLDAPSPFVRTAPNQIRSAQAANCTRPYWISWYAQRNLTCSAAAASSVQPPYSVIQTDVNNGYAYYQALSVNLSSRFSSRMTMLASYTWSHAIDNVDPDVPSQNPNDPNFTGRVENGNAIFDQRQRLVISGIYSLPSGFTVGGVGTLASGLPYNFVTGTTNSGDNGATTDRPVINGTVVGRNTGRGRPTYDLSPFIERKFSFGQERLALYLRAESFNILNHANFVGYSGTYGNGSSPGAGFGQPLAGITNQLPARSFQFSGRLTF